MLRDRIDHKSNETIGIIIMKALSIKISTFIPSFVLD